MFLPRRFHYFSQAVNREVVELFWQTTLFNLAIYLTYLFEPILLYNLGYSLTEIMLFFVVLYVAYAVLVFPASKITSKIGYKHSILISTVFYILYWFGLYQIKFHPEIFYFVPVLFALQKSFFWPPYQADIALNSANEQRNREVGALFSLVDFAAIIGPILGGFVSFRFGFPALFMLSASLLLLSVYPLFRSPEIYTKHEFQFRNFLSILKKYPRNFFAYWGYAEDLMLGSLWPIFIFFIIPEVLSIGAIATVASIISIMVMLYLGRVLDRNRDLNALPISATYYGLTWLFRFFAQSVPAVVGFDIASRLGKGMVNVPMLSMTYEIAGKKGPDHAIAYTVFYEFSLSIGKILTALGAILILNLTGSIPLVFLMVGTLTFFYGLLRK